MDNPNSYENVMRELERLADDDYFPVDIYSHLDDNIKDFKMEYAFESITEKRSAYKHRSHHV